jgi:hypothetical protein
VNTATVNTTNLQKLVSTLLDSTGPTGGNGGTIQFPSIGTYKFNGTITVGIDLSSNPQPNEIIFMGTAQGKITAPLLEQTASADLFLVNNNTGGSADEVGPSFV